MSRLLNKQKVVAYASAGKESTLVGQNHGSKCWHETYGQHLFKKLRNEVGEANRAVVRERCGV